MINQNQFNLCNFSKRLFSEKMTIFKKRNSSIVKCLRCERMGLFDTALMRKSDGFTLIETIVYMALFSIIIGGGMVASYQIVQATDASHNHIILQEEANFLFRKINWALAGATSANVPSNNTLESTKNSATYTFNLCGGNLTLQTGLGKTCSDSPITLNSSNLTVSPTSPSISLFKKTTIPGKPDAITAIFTLTTIQNNRNTSQNFFITKYLLK